MLDSSSLARANERGRSEPASDAVWPVQTPLIRLPGFVVLRFNIKPRPIYEVIASSRAPWHLLHSRCELELLGPIKQSICSSTKCALANGMEGGLTPR